MPGDDLTTTEGVDEGSATPEPTDSRDPTGPAGDAPDEVVAPPVPPGAEPPTGPGQQLQEGEG